MEEQVVVVDGGTFRFSDPNGDIEAERPQGYFFEDVRHLSRWCLTLDGKPFTPLTSRVVDHFSARFVGAPEGDDEPTVSVQRDRFVADGVHEDIMVTNHGAEERRVRLELAFACDFADVMEAQHQGTVERGRYSAEVGARVATLWQERNGYRRGTSIPVPPPRAPPAGPCPLRPAPAARRELGDLRGRDADRPRPPAPPAARLRLLREARSGTTAQHRRVVRAGPLRRGRLGPAAPHLPAAGRLDDLQRRPSALERDRRRAPGGARGEAAPAGGHVHRVGHSVHVRERRRLQPTRVPLRHRLAARHRDRRRGDATLRVPRRGRPGLRGASPGRGGVRLPAPRGLRRLRPRRDERPVEYPNALKPQAWAAGAPLLALRTLLGLDASGGKKRRSGHVPESLGRIRLSF